MRVFGPTNSGSDATRSERGATAVLTAVVLLFLMAMSALAVDASNLYRERGDAQNAADLAAYSAGFASCSGENEADSQAAGVAQAAANGYDTTTEGVTVALTQESTSPNLWRADVETTIGGFFSGILGADTLNTGATAVVQCVPNTVSFPAIFAGGECAEKTFVMSGQNDTIDGSVHSNGDFDLPSQDADYGPTTFAGELVTDPIDPSNDFDSGPIDNNTFEAWPIRHDNLDGLGLSIADFGLGGSVQPEVEAQGKFYQHTTGQIILGSGAKPGVYVSETAIIANGISGEFTLVVMNSEQGKVELTGTPSQITAAYKDFAIISDGYEPDPGAGYPYASGSSETKCDWKSVIVSGSSQASPITITGVIFAPRGQVSLSGQYITIDGGIISYTMLYGGSNLTINAQGGGSGTDPIVFIDE